MPSYFLLNLNSHFVWTHSSLGTIWISLSLICNSFIFIRLQDESFRQIFISLTCVCVFPGMFGLVFGLIGMMIYDGERVQESGMFQGYNSITWTVVALQVTLTSLPVIQYFSNVISSLWGFYFMDQTPCRPVQVMPLSICVRVFVVSPGAGWSGHSGGHQVCRQHPQGLCYIALHHPVNAHIVLLAAGLRPHEVEEAVFTFLCLSSVFFNHNFSSWRCRLLSSTACSSWGPFWSSRPLSCTATKASHPPTPAGRRTLTADTTAAVGGPVEASRRGVERRTESWREKKGKGLIVWWEKGRGGEGREGGKQAGNRGQEERKKKVKKIAQRCERSHTPKVPQLTER